ncbi:P-loop ATPase, Sll1717 family [Pseudoduganella sp. UC29_71]|uniref:P-loop ATPase, Sll1717 family n=1 Tax=Pseudoduganella sp. UC29_71 TaxID=3350174 RepID=UPI00366DDC0F
MKAILRELDIGNSVAEFDESLEKYFVENEAFYKLVNDKIDIVAGDKGTGKTALFQIIKKRYGSIAELKGIEVLAGFNPVGSPVFQKLVRERVLTEGQYASVWKAYIIALAGNWVLDIAGADYSESFSSLSRMLERTGLISKDDKPETIFSKIVSAVQRALLPTEAEIEFTFSETGVPVVTPKMKFGKRDDEEAVDEVSHEEAFALLEQCLSEIGFSLWIVLDRLDEAFQGFAEVEIPALRALFRTYLDLLPYKNVRLKLFVRRDLLRRITAGGFVNLTHINARKVDITWDEADLLNLYCRRVRDNKHVMAIFEKAALEKGNADSGSIGTGVIKPDPITDEDLFYCIFPGKIDQAERKPTTWSWIMSRIRDGNDVRPPRNLIGLAKEAQDEQLKSEGRAPRAYTSGMPIITTDAVRKALEKLSETRVHDTLLAEASPEVAAHIQKFRRSRSEHNEASLSEVIGLSGDALQLAINQLVQIGFLESLKASWKIPMLYRDGLEITQGKAFGGANGATPAEDDET